MEKLRWKTAKIHLDFFFPSSFTETIIFEFPFLPFFCNAEARSSFEVWSSPKGWFCRIRLWVAFL